jgi:hypothetical protein
MPARLPSMASAAAIYNPMKPPIMTQSKPLMIKPSRYGLDYPA